MEQETKIVKVEIEVLNNTLQYLSEQSYKDVAKLIADIQKSVQENNKQEEEKEDVK